MEKKLNYIINHKIWIENENGEGILGDGKWEFLKIIHATASLKIAIQEMGWGYRSTWTKLKQIEKRLGFNIIEKSRGGSGGGGYTKLTKEGEKLVEYFQKLHDDIDLIIKKPIEEFLIKVERINEE